MMVFSPRDPPFNTFLTVGLKKIISLSLSPLRHGVGALVTGPDGSLVVINNNNTPGKREIYIKKYACDMHVKMLVNEHFGKTLDVKTFGGA